MKPWLRILRRRQPLVAPVKEAITALGLPATAFAEPVFGPAGMPRTGRGAGRCALIHYCSGQADALANVPGLRSTRLPAAIDVTAAYGMAVMSTKPDVMRFALFLLSDACQAILVKHGLMAVLDDR